MIEIRGLAKRFVAAPRRPWQRGVAVEAVRGVDFRAEDGSVTGLLGPNGAGKTTTMRIVAGLIAPDGGRVSVDGIDVATRPAEALARLGVLGDARGLYPRLTARENIVYHGRLQGLSAAAANASAERLAERLGLAALLDRRAAGFSQGERMKTALARALVHDPPNLVLDEPTNGLDVLATRALRQVLRALAEEEGKCIVVSTHVMQEVERLCDRVTLVAGGRSVAEGTVQGLREQAGCADFEDAFVRLAFGGAAGVGPVAAGAGERA